MVNSVHFKIQFFSTAVCIILYEMVKEIVKMCNRHYFEKDLFIISDIEIAMRWVETPLLCRIMSTNPPIREASEDVGCLCK